MDEHTGFQTGADLTFPPNPFNHGPCRLATCTLGVDGGPAPAVFEGGLCAAHAQQFGQLSVAAGLQAKAKEAQKREEMAKRMAARDHARARRKAGAKSRSRNRR